jgi:PAS domain S-box-containing protein
LRASELNLRLIVDSIPGLVATMSPAGEFQLFNRQLLEYFGGTPEELKSWATSDVVHPDDLRRVIAAFKSSIETGHPYDMEHRCRRSGGVYRWFQVRALPVRDTEGRVISWYILLTDIDKRKQAEERLQLLLDVTFDRRSPAANTPGWLVSSRNGGRASSQWRDSARAAPVRTKALCFPLNLLRQPIRSRRCPDEVEYRWGFRHPLIPRLSIHNLDCPQVTVSQHPPYRRITQKLSIAGLLDSPYQITRHVLVQVIAPNQQQHTARVPRQKHNGLPCRVAAPTTIAGHPGGAAPPRVSRSIMKDSYSCSANTCAKLFPKYKNGLSRPAPTTIGSGPCNCDSL